MKITKTVKINFVLRTITLFPRNEYQSTTVYSKTLRKKLVISIISFTETRIQVHRTGTCVKMKRTLGEISNKKHDL